ncbi:hypothetical protein GJV85_04295 [Sulfurimonas aquatica]|uniref:Uncharacterized protein n=1 Tax=Sulfurimonas aquatica TaxID=2672570 RepID=A0A975AZB1_9BACT|nr:hypothetical protein [Sulfurimonas aquatica]QSZ41357.1 hypothetical protein GJV85_04295 [Sulfurimonas aquatica]
MRIQTDSIIFQLQHENEGSLLIAERLASHMKWKLEILKSIPVRPIKKHKELWKKTFGRDIPKSASFIAILETSSGIKIILIKYGNSKFLQIEFHGLDGLTKDIYSRSDNAVLLNSTLKEFIKLWNEPVRLMRLDRSVNIAGQKWEDYTNSRQHRKLCRKRKPELFKTTTIFYQNKKRRYIKVLAYDKQQCNGLDYAVTRIECRFLAQYWNNLSGEISNVIDIAIKKADLYIEEKLLY